MKTSTPDTKINKILLKPRFREELSESKTTILKKFATVFAKKEHKFRTKLVDNHIVIDVPTEEDHFWSPQLQIEIVEEENKTILKGLFGPKPQVWTMFMFFHFAVAVAFVVFLVMAYTKYSLKQEYQFAMYMCIAMPIIWIIFYVFGQLGKKKGYNQMVELDVFVKGIINGGKA
ncbi:GTP-binding protein [Aureibaculum sp. 2210JD6-5]|uniref:GTP-binding protein n=1 Tax=Aureibaculum sp. 2210JD6-5 TaxID=3103957 RepID=UPI002AAEC8CA|nr:GTP-binding protein [Aureibaculum sp. 2210JD6-5]MDY7394867.1 GTP-binding protein [Aureibaculum sp. 2210JD6-5]